MMRVLCGHILHQRWRYRPYPRFYIMLRMNVCHKNIYSELPEWERNKDNYEFCFKVLKIFIGCFLFCFSTNVFLTFSLMFQVLMKTKTKYIKVQKWFNDTQQKKASKKRKILILVDSLR